MQICVPVSVVLIAADVARVTRITGARLPQYCVKEEESGESVCAVTSVTMITEVYA